MAKEMTEEAAFFCPMLKANGYGHGAVPLAKALMEEGVCHLGLLNIEEALPIVAQQQHISKTSRIATEALPIVSKQKTRPDILIFGVRHSSEELLWGVRNHLVFVCSNTHDLQRLAGLKRRVRIHLKFDTGFSRLGFSLSQGPKLKAFLKDHSQIQLEGLATHLIAGEEIGDLNSPSAKQLKDFLQLKKLFPGVLLHALNSAGLIARFVHRQNRWLGLGARPGISLYGEKPHIVFNETEENTLQAKKTWANLGLFPVSCLKSHIVEIREVPKGKLVSYGGEWKAKRKSKIAVVPLGYGDGFLKSPGSQREVLFRGQRSVIAGAICMDFFMLDITDALKEGSAPARPDEEVVIFGKQKSAFLSPQDQARLANSSVYELFCRISPRIPRIYTSPLDFA